MMYIRVYIYICVYVYVYVDVAVYVNICICICRYLSVYNIYIYRDRCGILVCIWMGKRIGTWMDGRIEGYLKAFSCFMSGKQNFMLRTALVYRGTHADLCVQILPHISPVLRPLQLKPATVCRGSDVSVRILHLCQEGHNTTEAKLH